MISIDLQSPLAEFLGRTMQIRSIIVMAEAAGRNQLNISTNRDTEWLNVLSSETSRTANAMSIVYLASSFEEFVRQEIGLCASYLALQYENLDEKDRHNIRNLYWQGCIANFGRKRSIYKDIDSVKQIDNSTIAELRLLIKSADRFVIGGDAAGFLTSIFYEHSRNFKPKVVDEIAARLGIKVLIDKASDNNKLRTYFGVTHKKEVAQKLRISLDEFFDRRNEVVHQLTANRGYGVDTILNYINLFEVTTEAIKLTLEKVTQSW